MGSLTDAIMSSLGGTGTVTERLKTVDLSWKYGAGSLADRKNLYLPGPGSLTDREKAWWEAGNPTIPANTPVLNGVAGPGSGQITANWSIPTDGGSRITAFNVYVYESGTNTLQGSWTVNSGTATTYTTPLGGLVTGKSVYHVVGATNAKGSATYANFANVMVVP